MQTTVVVCPIIDKAHVGVEEGGFQDVRGIAGWGAFHKNKVAPEWTCE
jgi:hypothetical protein